MRFSLLLLTLLLCNNCLSEFHVELTSTNNGSSGRGQKTLNDEFQPTISTGETKPQTNLLDLNEDVLYIILEHLNITDLLSTAKADTKLSCTASNVFHRRYLNYSIEISRDDVDEVVKFDISPVGKTMKIYDYEMSVNILKYFMCVIQKLVIKNELLEISHSTIINDLINKHSTQLTTSLKLSTLQEDTLAQYTAPFDGVEDFECTIKVKQIGTNILPFNRLFPKLKRLTLRLEFGVDFYYIDCELPHLVHLAIVVYQDAKKQQNSIDGLLRKNAQIKSIVSYGIPAKIINKLLVKLENLTLHKFDVGSDRLCFENVKHFHSLDVSDHSIDKLSFPCLETLSSTIFHYSRSYLDAWMRFFKNHTNLTKLHVNEFHTTKRAKLLELTDGLINLVELKMESCNVIDTENMTIFIEKHPKLMKFDFSVLDYKKNRSVFRNIRERLCSEWHVRKHKNNDNRFVLERKVLVA